MFSDTLQNTKEDAVENEMVILPPFMEPEDGKKEEEKATLAEEGKEDDGDEREEASKAGEMVENPFFDGSDEDGDDDSEMDGAVGGSKGLVIKREAEDQEAKEEALRKAEAEEAALSNAKKGVEASLEEARTAWIFGCLQMLSGKQSWEQDNERETPANGHVATLSTEEVFTKAGSASDKEREDKMVDKSSQKELPNTSIKQELTLDEE